MKLAITSKNFSGVKYAAYAPGVGFYLEGAGDGGEHYIMKFQNENSAKPFIEQQKRFGNTANLI